MRCDQHIGLSERAMALVANASVEVSGQTYNGAFDPEPNVLWRYTLPDGRVLVEAVQAEPWSSGPVFFLALKDERGEWVPESLWPESEIESA